MDKFIILSKPLLLLFLLFGANHVVLAQVNRPENPTATAVTKNQISVSWSDPSTDKLFYYIERSENNVDFAEIRTVNGGTFSYEDKGLAANTTYYYRIRSSKWVFFRIERSDYSNVVSAKTFPEPPAAPSELSAVTKSQSAIDVTWKDNSDNEDGFQVARSEKNGNDFIEIASLGAGAQSFNDKDLKSNTTYFYRVRAFNSGGDNQSPHASATTFHYPPTLDAIPDPGAINEDATIQTINLTGISDGGDGGQTISITAVSENKDLIPNPEVIYTSPNSTGQIKYTSKPNLFGTSIITVTVKDSGPSGGSISNTISQSFKVTVNEVNDPPTLDAIPKPQAIFENSETQTIPLNGVTAGPGENQVLSIVATSDNPELVPNPTVSYTSPQNSGYITYKPAQNKFGKANITITVKDNGSGESPHINTVSRTFEVEVLWVNKAPTLDEISNPSTIQHSAGEQTIPLTGISAGMNDEQVISVTAVSDNNTIIQNLSIEYVSPSSTGILKFSPVPDQVGEANISVVVMDNGPDLTPHVNSFSRTFKVKITDIPLIQSVTFPDYYTSGSSEQIGITMHENITVDKVELHYKGIHEHEWHVETITGDNRKFFMGTPADEKFGPVAMEYYFKVYANGALEEESTQEVTYLKYSGEGIGIPDLISGDSEENYQIISIPLNLTQKAVPSVFEDDLGAYNPTQWRLFQYLTESDTTMEFHQNGVTSIEPGTGYWFISRHDKTVDTGEGTVFEVNKVKPFELKLKRGWNQIGNPYNMDLLWSDILAYNDNPEEVGNLFVFENGLKESNTLKKFRGGFVFSDTKRSIFIPIILPEGQSSGRVAAQEKRKSETIGEGWELNLVVKAAGSSIKGGLGMNDTALPGKDKFDEVALPRFKFIKSLNVNFDKKDSTFPFFLSKDIVPPSENHIWEFSVHSENMDREIVELSWDLPAGIQKDLKLVDLGKNRVIDMNEVQKYTYNAENTKSFKVYYGDSSFLENSLKPEIISLNTPFPNPFDTNITFSFSVPEAKDETRVEINIYDATGKLVATPEKSYYKAGYYESVWNGKKYNGALIAPGLYIYKFNITSGSYTKEFVGRLIKR